MSFENTINGFLDVLDTPNKIIGNGLDFIYDNTIGELTGTKDLFTGEDAKIIPEIASFFIPGGAAIKGIKALKNLSNVSKYNKAMENVSSLDRLKGTVNGHLAAYGQDLGAKRVAHQFGQYTKADNANNVPVPTELTFGNYNVPMSEQASRRILNDISIESPVPLYRGGDSEGIFFTPDKRIAKTYRRGGSLSDLIFNKNGMQVTKLPKGTKMAPGRHYDPLSPTGNLAGYEAIVLPEWR